MIQISSKLSLQAIKATDCELLFSLMKEVYPKAYAHFWKDEGSWYVASQYSKTNILKELSQEKSDDYFVLFNNEIIGNFRVVWDEKLGGIPTEKQLKLHRIYLDSKVQGKGIGKSLLGWLESNAKEKNYQTIWLEAMNKQVQAFEFYKKLGYQYHTHCFLEFPLLKDEVRKMSQLYKNI